MFDEIALRHTRVCIGGYSHCPHTILLMEYSAQSCPQKWLQRSGFYDCIISTRREGGGRSWRDEAELMWRQSRSV